MKAGIRSALCLIILAAAFGLGIIAYRVIQGTLRGSRTGQERTSEKTPVLADKEIFSYPQDTEALEKQGDSSEREPDKYLAERKTEQEQIEKADQLARLWSDGMPGAKEEKELLKLLEHVKDREPEFNGPSLQFYKKLFENQQARAGNEIAKQLPLPPKIDPAQAKVNPSEYRKRLAETMDAYSKQAAELYKNLPERMIGACTEAATEQERKTGLRSAQALDLWEACAYGEGMSGSSKTEEILARTLPVRKQLNGAGSFEYWRALQLSCETFSGDAELRAQRCVEALDIRRKQPGATPAELSHTMKMISFAFMAAGNQERGLFYQKESTLMLEQSGSASPLYVGAMLARHSLTAWGLGNYGDAHDLIERAVAHFQKVPEGKPYADAALRFARAMPPATANQEQLAAAINEKSKELAKESGRAALTQVFQIIKENGKSSAAANRAISSIVGLSGDAQYEAELKNLPRDRKFDRLYDESPAAASLLLRECRNTDCIKDIYPLMLRQKGILASALGNKMAVSPLELTERGVMDSQMLMRAGAEYIAGKQPSESTKKAVVEMFKRQLSSGTASRYESSSHVDSNFDIAKYLRADEAYVDFYRYTELATKAKEPSMCAVITAPGAGPFLVRLGSAADIDRAVGRWRDAVLKSDSNWNFAWQTLAACIWTPVERTLPMKAKRVWISPDGPLCWAPWTMVGGSKGREVSLVASWPQLVYLRRSKPNPSRALLLVQDVDYGPGTLNLLQVREDPSDLGRLSAYKVSIISGKGATKTAVLRAVKANSVIHLSTHGSYDLRAEGIQSFKSAFIALSGANAGVSGRLNALELADADLSGVNLITVAACQSGFGNFMDGQGILGIQMALAASGARATLLSLWNTPDNEATRTLLRTFYSELWVRGRGHAEALRTAQSQTRQRYPNPKDWAGWVLGGEGW